MSDEKSSPELGYDEQKPDLNDKNDNDSYSNHSNSQNSVYELHDQNRIHRFMIISSVVLACLFIAFAIGMIIGITIGFMAQQNQISKLEQQLTARNNTLDERIDNLESQILHCKHCNSTIHSDSSSYDDQELPMKVDNIGTAQNEIQSQLNSTQFMLSDHWQQIIALQQQTQENITRIEAKLFGLDEFATNISEQINHLSSMRDDHSDQLSRINSSITNISTQLTHFKGSFSNLTSSLETQKTEVASLDSRVSTLNLRVGEIDERDTMKDSQWELRISQIDQHVNGIQTDYGRVSDQLNTIDGRLDNLDRSSTAAFHPLYSAVIVLISSMIMVFTF